jgi:hypothetical protein
MKGPQVDDPQASRSADDGAAARRLLEPSKGAVEEIARTAGRDASLDSGFLGDYLRSILHTTVEGGRLHDTHLEACRRAGEGAAREGVALSTLLDLYLSATWRLWADVNQRADRSDPGVVGNAASVMFRAADDGAAALAEGYGAAQRRAIRQEESLRREFVDDLLRGGGDVALLAERAGRFGFNLAAEHLVAVARTRRSLVDAGPVHARIESHVLAAPGGREALVATKGGLLVSVFPSGTRDAAQDLLVTLQSLEEGPWQVAVGRPHAGPGGVARSFEEAREALELAALIGLEASLISFESLLPYRLLVGDRDRLTDLVETVLGPLRQARGGGAHLVATLEAFFEERGNVAAAARQLRLSTRAVSYRLGRIRGLTGYSPREPEGAFVLQLGVKGMRLLGDREEGESLL